MDWQTWSEKFPWERQKGETDRGYAAFSVYKTLGARRSLRKAAGDFYADRDHGATAAQLRQMEYWSSKQDWVRRVRAFDDYEGWQRITGQREEVREMSRRHAGLATMFQRRALEVLEAKDLNDISASDAIRMFDVAVKVERLARGESVIRSELSGIEGAPIEVAVTKRVEPTDVERLAKITAALFDAGIGVDE